MNFQDRLVASNSTEAKILSNILVKPGDVLSVTVLTSSAHAAEQDTPFSLVHALKTGGELLQKLKLSKQLICFISK